MAVHQEGMDADRNKYPRAPLVYRVSWTMIRLGSSQPGDPPADRRFHAPLHSSGI